MPIEQIIIYALLLISAILIIWIIRLESKINKIPSVKNDIEIKNNVKILQEKVKGLEDFEKQSDKHFERIYSEFKKTIKGIETIRFNPFKGEGIGGNQSFATALIDDKGNGVILSSLYSREKVSVFAKPIKNWGCEYEMSEEEKEVLSKAKTRK